jgi:hypothetical protein
VNLAAPYLFHPSTLYAIMPDPQSIDVAQLDPEELAIYRKGKRTPEEQQQLDQAKARMLSEGAKTFIKKLARDELFKIARHFETPELLKGQACEQDVIDLYNNVTFQALEKNTERRSDDLMTGECDLWIPDVCTLDAKTSWSIETFPLLSEDAHSAAYEWQGRGYMRLWNVPKHEVFYGLVDTPDELRRREPVELHKVSHIDPKLRITRITYERDMALEKKMETKVRAAQKYLAQAIAQARNEKGLVADWRAKFMKS